MLRPLLLTVLAAVAIPWVAATPASQLGPSPLDPASTGGIAVVDRALAKLSTHQRLLMVGAHPDDEDTALLAEITVGRGGEAAYLSLSRGEGGQNLIGQELGVGLGLIRSEELLSARRVEGARQFFTRAFDFGYTRSLEETLGLWPREVLLEDAARAIRRFKPQVVVSVFPERGGGHGQHQAAGLVAHEAFRLASGGDSHPRLTAEGLPSWRPAALYRETWFDPEATTVEIPLDTVDGLSGHSILQLAARSRSQHRSQDMGRREPLGSRPARLAWVAGVGGPASSDPFAEIDTRLAALAEPVADDELRRRLGALLDEVEGTARTGRQSLAPAALHRAVPTLGRIVGALREAVEKVDAAGRSETAVAGLLREKLGIAMEGLAAAAGIAADALADRERLTPGEEGELEVNLWNTGPTPVRILGLELETAEGWRGQPFRLETDRLGAGELGLWKTEVSLAEDTPLTVPYFLARPLEGSLYDWSHAPPSVRGEPFGPPPLMVLFRFEIEGVPLSLRREAVHAYADQATGEVRRPLRAVPALEVEVSPSLLLWSLQDPRPRSLEVALLSNAGGPLVGRLEVDPGEGWTRPEPLPFRIGESGGRQTLRIALSPPEESAPGSRTGRVTAVLEDGRRFALALHQTSYPHIRPRAWVEPSRVAIRLLDLRLPDLDRLGYVRGASDRVPEILERLDLPVEVLDARTLTRGDLATYDAIVVGSRAFETEPALRQANGRLLDYVRGGGLAIVQYQQYQYVRGGFAPYGLEIARPHDRVTDEKAPVRPLEPLHPVLRVPNRLDADDWREWVQERGLYFAHSWEEPFRPVLALRDPEQSEQKGGLLIAPMGEGIYVYTGLSFFRQLPAGVPGAIRLLANLLALRTEAQKEPA